MSGHQDLDHGRSGATASCLRISSSSCFLRRPVSIRILRTMSSACSRITRLCGGIRCRATVAANPRFEILSIQNVDSPFKCTPNTDLLITFMLQVLGDREVAVGVEELRFHGRVALLGGTGQRMDSPLCV